MTSHKDDACSELGQCACHGAHGDGTTPRDVTEAVDTALVHALFPSEPTRRALLQRFGQAGLIAALTAFLPVDTLRALAQEKAPLEKPKLNVGFLAITCAAPLIYGEHLGLYTKEGLDVSLLKIPGIGLIRDKMLSGELDVSQQVMPVALSMTAGIGGAQQSIKVLSILNQHGNSLVLAMKHKDNRDPRNWKGFTFAIPFEQSHQALQLRYYLAEAGLDPDKDVSYRVVPPSEYVSNLRVGSIDGFFGGEPGGQRAVYEGAGFIHALSGEIWQGHPCCSVTASEAWIAQHPNTFMAFYRAIIAASLHVADKSKREGMAAVLAQQKYLNAPEVVVEQVLTGRYADGLGNIKSVADRVDYNPFPHYSMAVFLLTQLRRWNMLKEDIDYKKLAEKVMLATDAAKLLREAGIEPPKIEYRVETIMGKTFDSNAPEAYLASVRKG
ncbi:MAG: nitrate ABC transporter substrate-binding protein [Hyphomicrobiales bacterium]|nr:MAG: nitrate ABC transporter substrate-binding protein [Hyphomicrobiales bacterium]